MQRIFVGVKLPSLSDPGFASLKAVEDLMTVSPTGPIPSSSVISSSSRISASSSRNGGIKWVPEGNLHLTLRFIGEVSQEKVLEIQDHLRTISCESFILSFDGVGVIPRRGPPRVLYVNGVELDGNLRDLQKSVETMISNLGYGSEDKGFLPHITIARLNKVSTKLCQAWMERHRGYLCDSVNIDHFSLFKSTLTPSGAFYEEIERYPLRKGVVESIR
eukprot:gene5125-5632_t